LRDIAQFSCVLVCSRLFTEQTKTKTENSLEKISGETMHGIDEKYCKKNIAIVMIEC